MLKNILILLLLLGTVLSTYGSGFHYPYEIWEGTFQGDYQINGSLSILNNQLNSSEFCLNGDCRTSWPGAISGVTAGIGLIGGGTSGIVTLDANTSYLQRRVSSGCAANWSIRAINSDGSVVCELDDSGIGSESDPVYSASASAGITGTDVTNWNTAYGWGNHAAAGYLTSYSETDPQVGTLSTGKWCTESGGQVVCSQDAPMSATTDNWVDITGDTVSGQVIFTNTNGIQWESGVNRITHNDGGGNVQIRFGHDYSTSDERFTHSGNAFYIGGNLDSSAGTLQMKVASNGGAGNDQPVTWGSTFEITPSDVKFGGNTIYHSGNNPYDTEAEIDAAVSNNGYLTSETGDISGVTAGNGLTGGGTTGAVTLNVASHAGTAGSIGTVNIGADTIGVNLGTTSTTAFRGDYGNTAYTHSQATSNVHGLSFTAEGSGGGLDADTVDGLSSGSFWRRDSSNAYDLRLSSGNGRGMRFWDSDLYKIYMSSSADATWGGSLDSTSDYNMYFKMSAGTNRGFVFKNDATALAQIDGAGNLFVTGNVGIGTSNPSGPLEIKTTGNSFGYIITNNTDGNTGWILKNDVESWTVGIAGLYSDSFIVNNNAGVSGPEFIIDINGNVGIGTTGPVAKLDVIGNIAGSGGYQTNPAFTFNDDLDTGMYSSTADELRFTTGGSVKMEIDASGNVGIGTTTPSAKLHVAGSGLVDGSFLVKDYLRLYDYANSVIKWDFITQSDDSLGIYDRVNTIYRLHIEGDNGYIGIGTTTPNVALDVIGSIEYTGTIADVSDRRLKENIKPLTNALDKTKAINGIYFDMINKTLSNRTEVGVIAQDVEKVLPEIVTQDNKGFKAVDYTKLSVLAIEAVKELKQEKDKEIEELKNENKLLKIAFCKKFPEDEVCE